MTLIEKLLATAAWQEPEAAGGDVKPDAAPPPAADQGGDAPAPAASEDSDGGDDDIGDLIGSGSDDERKVVVPADWPDDWRTKLAGDDEKIGKRLERFKSPQDLLKSWQAAEQKISSGEYKKSLDDAETDEEAAEIREQMGIPDDPSGYELPEFSAVELDADDPGVQLFLEKMHGEKATTSQVQTALKAYEELVIDAQEKQVDADKSYRMENEDALRAEWGNEYRPRIQILNRMVKDEDGPIKPSILQSLATARDADGNRVFNNKEVASWLSEIGLNHYGEGALLTGEQAQAQQNREAEILGVMKTDFEKYYGEVQSNGKTMAQELIEIRSRQR